jgi:hypothetical protein
MNFRDVREMRCKEEGPRLPVFFLLLLFLLLAGIETYA